MDPKYQEAFASDPEAALADLGIDLTPAEVIPLIDREAALEATRLVRAGRAAEVPSAVLRYRYFIHEKIEHRPAAAGRDRPWRSAAPRLAGADDQPLHRRAGPGAGRTRSCTRRRPSSCPRGARWAAGSAGSRRRSSSTPGRTPSESGQLWRECLGVVAQVYGIAARRGFLYWATDPLDNPDYEHSWPTSTTCSGSARRPRPRRGRRTSSGPGGSCSSPIRWARPSTGSRSSR